MQPTITIYLDKMPKYRTVQNINPKWLLFGPISKMDYFPNPKLLLFYINSTLLDKFLLNASRNICLPNVKSLRFKWPNMCWRQTFFSFSKYSIRGQNSKFLRPIISELARDVWILYLKYHLQVKIILQAQVKYIFDYNK